MTEHTRRNLCKVMVFAQVDKADSIILQDDEKVNGLFLPFTCHCFLHEFEYHCVRNDVVCKQLII